MKKLMIPLAIMLFSSTTFAEECRRKDNQCSTTYSRVDAYQVISDSENSVQDTKLVMERIMSLERDTGLSSFELAKMYQRIIRSLGGSSNTSDALKILSNTEKLLSSGTTTNDVAKAVTIIARSENSPEDASRVFKVVARDSLLANVNVIEVANAFETALRGLGGSSNTADILQAMSLMSNYAHIWSYEDMAQSIYNLGIEENSAADAVGNFQVVLQASEYCSNLAQPTKDFNSILSANGGASHTLESRSAFRSLYRL